MSDFLQQYQGQFRGVLRWHQLDALWEVLRNSADHSWYVYNTSEKPPQQTVDQGSMSGFIDQTDQLLRRLHNADYCGLAYTDNFDNPAMIKVFHPKRMGTACGSSGRTILPMWIISRSAPVDLLDWIVSRDKKPSWWKQMVS